MKQEKVQENEGTRKDTVLENEKKMSTIKKSKSGNRQEGCLRRKYLHIAVCSIYSIQEGKLALLKEKDLPVSDHRHT
jgi:hypothetical protein